MSSLSRVAWTAQQRVDLQHLLASDSFNAFDLRTVMTMLVGANPMIVKGFEVVSKTGLSITINIKDATVINPSDGNGSFYTGLPTDSNVIKDLPSSQANIFIEAVFKNVTQTPINTASWDPLALTGDDVAGNEFSSSINSQVVTTVSITVNTVGFTAGSVPLLRASTDSNSVTKMVDCRPLLFRLGSGGTTPNPGNQFPWGASRHEPVYSGTGVDNETLSPFAGSDTTGIINDKGFGWLKQWMDAMMTRICDFSGSPIWYVSDSAFNNPLYGYVTGLNLSRIYLDSEAGHSIQPSESVSLKWRRQDPSLAINELTNRLLLTSEGPIPGILDPDNMSTIKWQANYGRVSWELGGSFTSNVPGGSRKYSNCHITSPYVADGYNLYLFLQRDVSVASGSDVSWYDTGVSTGSGFDVTKRVNGVAGDFTGIAIGDWVRKTSEGFSQYNQVVGIYDSIAITTSGYVASAAATELLLQNTIASGYSSEPIKYFRSRYENADLASDTSTTCLDSNFYWIGRRAGTSFMLRGYGNMQEGEETLVKDDAFLAGGHTGGQGNNGLMYVHGQDAVYDGTNAYKLKSGATTTLLTIHKKKSDNTIPVTPGDNTNSFLTYTIAAPVGTMTLGQGLWVRLSDITSGALTNGNVVDAVDDDTNTDVNTNRWQVLSLVDNPIETFDNKNVFLVARVVTLPGGSQALMFSDDSILGSYGRTFDSYVQITQDLKVQNDVFGLNTHTLVSSANQTWWNNLGAFQLTIGEASSTIYIPGTLIAGGPIIYNSIQYGIASTKTANYTVAANDCVIPFDTTSVVAPISIYLPLGDGTQKGRLLIVKDVGGNCSKTNKYANVVPNGTDTIDSINASVRFDNDLMSLTFVCNGSNNWLII